MSKSPQASARKIAALLMEILNFPKDNSLVPLFGTGHEANNLDAITLWVACHLHEIGDADATLQRLQHSNRLTRLDGGDHATL